GRRQEGHGLRLEELEEVLEEEELAGAARGARRARRPAAGRPTVTGTRPMEKKAEGAGGLDVTALLGDLARDSEKLIRLQFDLLRSDLGRELRTAGGAALALGA